MTSPPRVLLREHLDYDKAEREDVRRLPNGEGVVPYHLFGSEVVAVH